jgi:potassium-transporting ATPase KdpC subunit
MMNMNSPLEPVFIPSDRRPSRGAVLATAGRQLAIAVRFLIAMTLVLGVLYPLTVMGVARIWSNNADGSLLRDGSARVVGSALIGQQFDGPTWFHGRPSAAGHGYDAMSSGASNLSADSPELLTLIQERRAALAAANGVPSSAVPADALTASASGLDPDISPAYALIQVNRVAVARGLDIHRVRDLVQSQVQGRVLGFIGEERVNVLELNLMVQRLGE